MVDGALEVGIVCGRCETFSLMGEARCIACGHDLSLFSAAPEEIAHNATRPTAVAHFNRIAFPLAAQLCR